MNEKRLVRPAENRMLMGVAIGVAQYFNIDPVLVRLTFILLLALTHGTFGWFYLLLAILMPSVQLSAKSQPFDDEEIVIN